MRKLLIAAVAFLLTAGSGLAAETQTRAAFLEALKPAPMTLPSFTPLPSLDVQFAQACCKRCSKGKPCGNSCISRAKQCHKGPGCAC